MGFDISDILGFMRGGQGAQLSEIERIGNIIARQRAQGFDTGHQERRLARALGNQSGGGNWDLGRHRVHGSIPAGIGFDEGAAFAVVPQILRSLVPGISGMKEKFGQGFQPMQPMMRHQAEPQQEREAPPYFTPRAHLDREEQEAARRSPAARPRPAKPDSVEPSQEAMETAVTALREAVQGLNDGKAANDAAFLLQIQEFAKAANITVFDGAEIKDGDYLKGAQSRALKEVFANVAKDGISSDDMQEIANAMSGGLASPKTQKAKPEATETINI